MITNQPSPPSTPETLTSPKPAPTALHRAERFLSPADSLLYRGAVRHVKLDRGGTRACRLHRRGRLAGVVAADVRHGNVPAVGGGADCMGGGPRGDEIHGGGDDERETRQCSDIGIFGDQGNDDIFGGDGNDGIEGEEGDDEIHGGDGSDFIDAADEESPNGKDTVDCGDGEDEAIVNANDDVDDNCEDVTEE